MPELKIIVDPKPVPLETVAIGHVCRNIELPKQYLLRIENGFIILNGPNWFFNDIEADGYNKKEVVDLGRLEIKTCVG